MLEPTAVAEKKFNAETQRIIGEAQLHKYAIFLDKFSGNIQKQQEKLPNVNNVTYNLITVDNNISNSCEDSHLTHSDNKILSRIMASLVGMCNEIEMLLVEAEQLYGYFVYYETVQDKCLKHESIAKLVKSLQLVYGFVNRTREVVVLTLKQLCAILGKKLYFSNDYSLFPEILHCLGNLLICLLKFDHLLDVQTLRGDWFLYRKTVRNSLHSGKINLDKKQLNLFDKTLTQFEVQLLMSTILKNTMQKCLEDKNFYSQIKNCSLNNEIYNFINVILQELEKNEDVLNRQLWWKLNIYVAFYFNIFGNLDRKLLKRVMEINRRLSACTLIGNIVWYPERFLLKHINLFEKYVDEKSFETYRSNMIQNKTANLPKEVNLISNQSIHFLIEFKKVLELNTKNLKVKQLQEIINLLIMGLKLIKKVNLTSNWILNLHADKDIPITKSTITATCKLVEITNCILTTFKNNTITFAHILLLINQHLQHNALTILMNIRKQFIQEKSYKNRQLDVISALNLAEQSLKKFSFKNNSLLVTNLSLSASGLSANDLTEIRTVLKHLETFSKFTFLLQENADCSFLFWHFNYVLPVYFSKLITNKIDISRYDLMLKNLPDSPVDLILSEDFFKPLEQVIEMNLRLQTHLHLQLPNVDPFDNYFSLNFRKYHPVMLKNKYKSLRDEIEHRLSRTFYDLTSVVLYDWRTYGEMRMLARTQYGLNTIDDNLPMQTLEQGLDVLEIMRNIDVFVERYLYNLNSQVFIERDSNSKNLNTIGISHVANSIRTHGLGIMNTTVNFAYQFLRGKFYVFSQFIYDENVKSRLIKDCKYFKEHNTELNQMYPYERAEKFNVGIKKLGLNEKGESYLDMFRIVVTQIGNTMGYVRLIRSGGRRCLFEATSFIPDLSKTDILRDLIQDEVNVELPKRAADSLLQNLQTFNENIKEATEYFKLLVKVFVPVLTSKDNSHLKYFYMIVPPLTVNYVEHILNCKEKLNKRNKMEYCFTDDGFALGLAYIIEILRQEEKLKTLHWFHSIQKKLENDKASIKEEISGSDNKLKQTLSLSSKKVNALGREFKLLYYSFNSARLFFHN